MKPLTCNSFSDEDLNALRSALTTAANNSGHEGEYCEYEFMEKCPRTSFVVNLWEALKEHGYKIVKDDSDG